MCDDGAPVAADSPRFPVGPGHRAHKHRHPRPPAGIPGYPLGHPGAAGHLSVTNFTLLAIPFFILAGRLCNEAQITNRMRVRQVPGGPFPGLRPRQHAAEHDLRGHVRLGRGGCRRAGKHGDQGDGGQGLWPGVQHRHDSLATIGPIIPPSVHGDLRGHGGRVRWPSFSYRGLFPGIIIGLMMIGYLVGHRPPGTGSQAKPRATWREMGPRWSRLFRSWLRPS